MSSTSTCSLHPFSNHRTVVWSEWTVFGSVLNSSVFSIVVLVLSPGTGTGLLVAFLVCLLAFLILFQALNSLSTDNCSLVPVSTGVAPDCQFHYLILA